MSIYIFFFCFFKASKESEQVEIAPTAEEPVKRTSRCGKSEPEKTRHVQNLAIYKRIHIFFVLFSWN